MLMFLEQVLNGLQYSALLFLLSAGLTLVFGIMNVINLTHGSFYMVGAFCAASAAAAHDTSISTKMARATATELSTENTP